MRPGPGYPDPNQQYQRFPQQRRRLPLLIGVLVAVVVVGVAAALIFTLAGGDGDEKENKAGGGDTTAQPTSAATDTGVTYEITGTAPAPLDVMYAGENGEDVNLTVIELPWSVTVDPAPDLVSIFAVNTSIEVKEDITLTLKRGTEVLRTCRGGAPCLTEFPS